MIIELKSLLPVLEECLEETIPSFRRSAASEVTALFPPLSGRDTFRSFEELPLSGSPEYGLPSPETAGAAKHFEAVPQTSGESLVARLLEQLIQCSERNALSTERIAELLESGDNSSPVYN